jgi:SAM-dependent methyltransferase
VAKRLDSIFYQNELAGAREPFVDAELYDFEYRRRRADIAFYRALARNRMEFSPGPILDLGCGTGRLLVPLLRDGHMVVGLDHSSEMLTAANRRIHGLSPGRRRNCVLVRADLRAFALRLQATLAIAAFHSVQHLYTDADFLCFLRNTRACLAKGSWLLFDVLPPNPTWFARDPKRRWARTVFRHPITKQRLVYTTNHVYDAQRQVVHMRLYYAPVDEHGTPRGKERILRLSHRQFWPVDIKRMLESSGFRLTETFGGFDGRTLDPSSPWWKSDRTEMGELETADEAEEHIYLAIAK